MGKLLCRGMRVRPFLSHTPRGFELSTLLVHAIDRWQPCRSHAHHRRHHHPHHRGCRLCPLSGADLDLPILFLCAGGPAFRVLLWLSVHVFLVPASPSLSMCLFIRVPPLIGLSPCLSTLFLWFYFWCCYRVLHVSQTSTEKGVDGATTVVVCSRATPPPALVELLSGTDLEALQRRAGACLVTCCVLKALACAAVFFFSVSIDVLSRANFLA